MDSHSKQLTTPRLCFIKLNGVMVSDRIAEAGTAWLNSFGGVVGRRGLPKGNKLNLKMFRAKLRQR